tara:strand:- start:23 stop:199 length:177 start_codon:yes stop_codon:yes gene_type:complete
MVETIVETLWMKWTPGSIDKAVYAVLFLFAGSIAAQCQLPSLALFSDFEVEASSAHDP